MTFFTRLFLFICFHFGTRQFANPPHLILIIVDDLGWNDVSYHGASDIQTPNIDSLASDSLLLNNYYVNHLCTPSRSALLTGRYASNIGMQNKVIRSGAPWGLPLELRILPQYLKDLGYSTALIGKWHLGFHRTEYTPTFRGFDYHYGYWQASMDYYNHKSSTYVQNSTDELDLNKCGSNKESVLLSGYAIRENMKLVENTAGNYSTDLFTSKAEEVIRNHSLSEPLFLTISPVGVHRGNMLQPITAPDKYTYLFDHIDNEERKQFAGRLKGVDLLVGHVFKALEKRGMLNNSVVVLTTDNGADSHHVTFNGGSNWPLRGQKFTAFEGGVRGVGMVWSPLMKKRGSVKYDGLAHITDWLPTLLAAAGQHFDNSSAMDGHNLWESFQSSDVSNPRKDVLIDLTPELNRSAYRNGRFKFVSGPYHKPLGTWVGTNGTPSRTNRHSQYSIVEKVLKSFYRNDSQFEIPSIKINCGIKLENANHSCNPEQSPCLFDLLADPCEFNNVATKYPQVVSSMLNSVRKYTKLSRKARNKIVDPESNPKLYGGAWVTWLDDQFVQLRRNLPKHYRDELCTSQQEQLKWPLVW